MREQHQTLYSLPGMWLAWPRREFGRKFNILQGMHRRIGLSCPLDRRYSRNWMARGSFKFEVDKYKAYSTHLLSNHLIRWRAFELSEGSSRNWRDISVLVLLSISGAIMKVAIMVSCSHTSRVARAQKGLICPIGHINPPKDIAMNDNSYPKLE